MTYCDTPAGIEVSFWTHGRRTDGHTEGQTDVEVKIVIQKLQSNTAATRLTVVQPKTQSAIAVCGHYAVLGSINNDS